MNAPVVYLVKFWVKPGGEKKVFDWLDGGHLQDVVAQPGFRWASRYKLTEPDKDGWPAYAMIYGVKSADRCAPISPAPPPSATCRSASSLASTRC